MPRTFDEINSEFDALAAKDFNLWNTEAIGLQTLYSLTQELSDLKMPTESAKLLLNFVERASHFEGINPSFDLGTPGPIVHTLERMKNYEVHLIESLKRQPTPLTVWMVNRILNAVTDRLGREFWLEQLRTCINHRNASDSTRQEASEFLRFQTATTEYTTPPKGDNVHDDQNVT